MSWWRKILNGLGIGADTHTPLQHPPAAGDDDLAEAVIRARQQAYAGHFGTLPAAGILQTGDGGAQIDAYKIRSGEGQNTRWIYITAGLANPDIVICHNKAQAEPYTDAELGLQSGYGYEIMVIAEEDADWPLALLRWAVRAECTQGIGLLAQVEQYGGMTVSDIALGNGQNAQLFIHKAQAPWPAGFTLPNGHITLLVITTISAEEMNWSLQNGRAALLEQLLASPVGQTSIPGRASVAEP